MDLRSLANLKDLLYLYSHGFHIDLLHIILDTKLILGKLLSNLKYNMEGQEKGYDKLKNEVLKMGELNVENIIEIQYLLKLIHESNMSDEQKKSTGLCLNMLITLSNMYIEKNADLNKLNKTNAILEEEEEEEDLIVIPPKKEDY